MRVCGVMIFGKVQWAATFLESVVVCASYLFLNVVGCFSTM